MIRSESFASERARASELDPAARRLIAAALELFRARSEALPPPELTLGDRSLRLVRAIADSIDRAILLVVQGDALVALGGFGAGLDGRLLAEVTPGLNVSRRRAGLLAACLAEARPRAERFEEAGLPIELAELLGRPRSHQALAFPLLAGERAIAVIYADNGRRREAAQAAELLARAAAC